MKKVSVIISIIVLLGLAYWAFHTFVNKQNSVFDPLSVVPEDALLIAEFRDGGKDAATFYQRSMLWKDFEDTPFAKEALPFFLLLDSLNDYNNIVISLHENQVENLSLITITDPNKKLQKLLIDYGAVKDKVASSHIYQIAGSPYLFDINDDFIRITKNRDLLLRTQNYIDQGKSVLSDSSFVKIRPNVESENSLKLFINLDRFSNSLNRSIIEDIFDFPENLKGWLSTDLYDRANTIISSGFIEFDSEEDNFFNAYENQIPQGLHYFDILPANTAILTASGYSNPSNYLKKITDESERSKYFSSWLGNAYGSGILNGEKAPSELRFAFFEIRDKETFTESTQKYIDDNYEAIKYRDFTIAKLDSSYTFECFNEGISEINNPFFCIIKEYVVFSENEETLKEIIKRYKNDNTLSLQESFSNLRDELSDETNYLFYISPAMAGTFLKTELADSLRKYWLPQEDKINSLQAMIVQVSSYKKGKVYIHSVLRHQVVNFQEKSNSLWELYTDTPLKGDVYLLRNHYTQHLDIAVQDSNNVLFLINNKGEILWEKELDGEILDKIHQVDIYKNGKLQLLFNTENSMYCTDRKGNDLEKFPVKFNIKTQNSIALFDYDSNKKYRIITSFPNGKMNMYDARGNKLKGWKFRKVRSAITETPQHIRIGKKDYIYTSTANGTILLLDRKGSSRYKSKENIADKNGRSYIYTGRSIAASGIYFIDTLGIIVNVPFGGQKEYLPIKGKKQDELYMARINEDNSREFILYNSSSINVYDVSGVKLYDEITVNNLGGAPKKYRFEQQNWLGYSDNTEKEAYLIDAKGNLKPDAPFSGMGRFRMGDINKDGIMELVIKGDSGQLVVYSLSN